METYIEDEEDQVSETFKEDERPVEEEPEKPTIEEEEDPWRPMKIFVDGIIEHLHDDLENQWNLRMEQNIGVGLDLPRVEMDEGEDPPPELPEDFKVRIREMNGTRGKDEGGGRDASKANTTISGRNYSNLQEMEDEGKLSSLRVYEGMEVDRLIHENTTAAMEKLKTSNIEDIEDLEWRKMKTILSSETMDIPEGVKIKVKAKIIEVEGPRGKLSRNFKHLNLDFQLIKDESGNRKLKIGRLVRLSQDHRRHPYRPQPRREPNHRRYQGDSKDDVVVFISSNVQTVLAGVDTTQLSHTGMLLTYYVLCGLVQVRKVDMLDGVSVVRSEKVKDELVLDGNDIELVSRSAALINQKCHVKKKTSGNSLMVSTSARREQWLRRSDVSSICIMILRTISSSSALLLSSCNCNGFLQLPPMADDALFILSPMLIGIPGSDFSSSNPSVYQDVKLLGSAKFSDDKASLQIPDASQAVDLRHQAGRAIYSAPIRLFDPPTQTPASFQTTFSFQFNNSYVHCGRPGPWLAMLNDACDDDYKSVAIEFDTHKNPEFGDPNDNHVGINLGTIVSTTTRIVSLKDGSMHRAWISYDGLHRWMDLRLGSDNSGYPSQPTFSGPLDISPYLKEYMFVGFSASTGNHTQIHNILSWNFTSTSQASLLVPSTETCESKVIVNGGQSTNSSKTKAPSSFLIFLAVVVLGLAVLLNLYYNGKRRHKEPSVVLLSEKKQRPQPPNKPRRFTISEISSATRCFSDSQELGSDSRGTFYKGTLLNGSHVAVKRFSAQFLSSQGLDRRRIMKEIGAVSRVRHPNLVPIRGWCKDNRETMVVYDYLPNGSLDKWLFGAGVLPWTRRFKVVKDVADGLSFIHSKQLAHKNMKTSSVFLDISFRAMLVVAGRRRMEPEAGDEQKDLLDFAWRMHEKDERVRVVDRRMGSVINLEQAILVLEIGLLCTLNETKGRPYMEEVVGFLAMDRPVPQLPPCRPISLFPYSSTTGLCSGNACSLFK
ncbi:putative L-type lectin-domain containing receptor kinase S.7 [Vitis vinifera]|uniref:Putative L-type lectin-domain containing receptor kinase S.7 n=1 Tax=Vitis vinifera TaxID=29760 RepID=A0A438E0V0_VITVI|nr:putative L-type lectin-domain containing receptor kinase S.7 [Vitis vinifera]